MGGGLLPTQGEGQTHLQCWKSLCEPQGAPHTALHPRPQHTFSLSGSVSLAWPCLLISAMVLGPFLSALEEKPWLDSRSSKWLSDTRGF